MIKKCIIAQYDANITKPPYETIKVDSMEVIEPEVDEYGVLFADALKEGCRNKGYKFKFYTSASKEDDYDYEVVVYGDYEKKDLFQTVMDLQTEMLTEHFSDEIRNRLKNQ